MTGEPMFPMPTLRRAVLLAILAAGPAVAQDRAVRRDPARVKVAPGPAVGRGIGIQIPVVQPGVDRKVILKKVILAKRVAKVSTISAMIDGNPQLLTLEPSRVEEPAPAGEDDFDEVDVPEGTPKPPAPVRSVLAGDNFDMVVWGERGRAESRLAELDRLLVTRVNRWAGAVGLDDGQKAKLLLAGRGDIKHLLDRVEAKRAEFEAVRADFRKSVQSLQGTTPLAFDARRGPFDAGSLYDKTLKAFQAEKAKARAAR